MGEVSKIILVGILLALNIESQILSYLSLPADLGFKQNCLLHPNEQFSMIVLIIINQNQPLVKSSCVDPTTQKLF